MKYALGIDVGGTRTKAGIVELDTGIICNKKLYATEKKEKYFLNQIKEWGKECNKFVRKEDVIGVGIAVSGYVHKDTGIIDESCGNFLPFFPSYPIGEKISRLLNLPCQSENDAVCACYGEALYGSGKNKERVLMITLGTGVGVGFVSEQQITKNSALIHRAGHIKVASDNIQSNCCYCGISGCMESLCSGVSLSRMAFQKYGKKMGADELLRKAEKGERKAENVLNQYLEYLTCGLNQYVYLFAPDVIVIGQYEVTPHL